VAAAVTFRKEPPVKEKAAWIFLIALLMLAEIRNLYVDRDEHNKQQALISQSIAQQGQMLSGVAQNIQLSLSFSSIARELSSLKPQGNSHQRPPVITVAPAYGNLRERTIQLSQELYGLVSGQQQWQQQELAAADAKQAVAIVHMSTERLSWEYTNSFESRVNQTRDDFAKLNIRDSGLEAMIKSIERIDALDAQFNRQRDWIVNGADVMEIARDLTNLASKLPPN
jgi:hypothetical protein